MSANRKIKVVPANNNHKEAKTYSPHRLLQAPDDAAVCAHAVESLRLQSRTHEMQRVRHEHATDTGRAAAEEHGPHVRGAADTSAASIQGHHLHSTRDNRQRERERER